MEASSELILLGGLLPLPLVLLALGMLADGDGAGEIRFDDRALAEARRAAGD